MLVVKPAVLLLLWSVLRRAICVKEADFKKCGDSDFCRGRRGHPGDPYSIEPSSVDVTTGSLTATLANDAHPEAQFAVVLESYGGIVRLSINEKSNQKQVQRFSVPEVLSPDLDKRKVAWERFTIGPTSASVGAGAYDIFLDYKPFKITVIREQTAVLVFNSQNLFEFEHHRVKQEGDPEAWWQETFKGHVDSKPKGPEAISFDLTFLGFKHVYGLPERATSLALKPTAGEGITSEPYRLYNLDVFEYEHESPFGLYGSIPLVLAHKADLTLGAFWLNTAEMYVDVLQHANGTETQWLAESGVLDLWLFLGPSPADVLREYGAVTGTTAMPQYFALGYHQCRWNYRDEADVRSVDAHFDLYDIPYDVIWLDIEHTDGKRYFTWDKAHFPEPARLQEDIAGKGRKTVVIIDPHIKRDTDWDLFIEAQKQGFFVKNKENAEFDGWCWPGSSSYLDMLNPAARNWWATRFQLNKYPGSTQYLYVWNDMNEPSVFNGPEITMPKDNRHFGEVEHRELHNLYGMLYHQATAQGLAERGQRLYGSDGDRPFVLSRAFFAGTQRIGPIWTGDNTANWEHLRVGIPMLLTLNVAGLPFSGNDVGGFFGNPEVELLVRWYQVAAYFPFFRGHAHLDTKRREPWLFGDEATSRIRAAIRERYAILPYMYTLFRHAHTAGLPIMRPMWYEFPSLEAGFAMDDQFMLGPALLVAPVLQAGATSRPVLLPTVSRWFDAHTGIEYKPGYVEVPVTMDSIPIYFQGGNIVAVRTRARRSTTAAAHDPITLIVALDAKGTARGDLYLDDGRSFAFRRGVFAHREFTFVDGLLSNEPFPADSAPQKFSSTLLIERVVILGAQVGGKVWHAVELEGQRSLTVSEGPLWLAPGIPSYAVIIRKPELPVIGDWRVQIST